MAGSGMYPSPATTAPRVVGIPQQKKIMDDVLECIIQLKSEFFENHQPINDDNISLQRVCAKLEHLIQMGMREKTSLLGRKKDYWDYFCDCLGSAKGSNDGIRYVKNLRENKTSLGRGRAFIRFCLVHQRLADALQQCLVHSEKTSLWFLPNSVLCHKRDANTLVSALYDLNSMHFDLAPRGYDLDSDWPSFASRKMTPGGSWNIPISRRSSITSMDTISQASISLATSPDVDRLHKDLEAAHSARSDVQDQLGALQKEKEEVSQSAWESQGKVAALQEQLNTSQSQHASLQERYRELDVNFVKMKLEKDHLEKLLSDERKMAEEQESKRVHQLQDEEEVWKREMKEEGERRRKQIDKLNEELTSKTEEQEDGRRTIQHYCDLLVGLMSEFKIEVSSHEDFVSNIGHVRTSLDGLNTQLTSLASEKASCDGEASKTLTDNERLSKELEKHQQEMASVGNNLEALNGQITSLESELREKCQECESLNAKNLLIEKDAEKHREEVGSLKELNQELRDKEKTLKELNQTMKGRIVSEYPKYIPASAKVDFEKYLNSVFEKDDRVLELQQQMLTVEREIVNHVNSDGENNVKAVESMKKLNSDMKVVLKEREEMLRSMLSELQAIEMKSGKFEKEVGMLEHGGQVLNEQLSLSEARVEFASIKLKDEEAKLAEMSAKQEVMVKKMKEDEILKVNLEKEKNELTSRVTELSSLIDSTSREKEVMKKKMKDVAKEKQKLQEHVRSAQSEIEKKDSDLCHEKDKIAVLMKDSDGEKDSKAQILEQITKVQGEKEQVRKEKEEMVSLYEKENLDLKEKLETLESEQEKLVSDIETLKNKADEEQVKAKLQLTDVEKDSVEILEQVNKEILLALKQCEHSLQLNCHLSDSEEADDTAVESSQGDNEDHKDMKTEVHSNMNNLCDRLKILCNSHGKMEEITRNQFSAVLEEEKDRLLSEVDAALEETHHIKSQLEQTSELLTFSNSSLDTISTEKESLQTKLSTLLEEISHHQSEKDELGSKMSTMIEEISRHEAEKDNLRREMAALKADCERAEDDVQDKLGQKRELEMKLEETEEKLEEVSSEKQKLERAAEGLYTQSDFSHQVLEESLTDSQSALQAAKTEKIELEDKCTKLETEKKDLEERLRAATDSCQSLKEGMETRETVDDGDDQVTSLRKKLEDEKAKYELEIDTLNSEISSLQFQMSSAYIEEQADLQSDYPVTATQSSLEELETEIKLLEDENERLRIWKDEEGSQETTKHNAYVLKIESQESQLKTYERTMMEMQSQVDEAESSKDEMSIELTQLQLSAKKRLEDRDKELQMLISDNEGMKRQILKLIKDKDNLWQKTDALVDEKKRKASDRWMDNSKVTKCLLCKAEFSLFLRKHHCRLCGSIFCWSCSDFWLDTAHSSKKARVCKICFDQKTNPDASMMGTSMIDNESDNDDDDDEDDSNAGMSHSFLHTINESGNAEIREVPRLKKNGDGDSNDVDEGKWMQSVRRSPSIESRIRTGSAGSSATGKRMGAHSGRLPYEMETDSLEDSIYNAGAEIRVGTTDNSGEGQGDRRDNGDDDDDDTDDVDDSVYQVITQAEVAKTMTDYSRSTRSSISPAHNNNMTRSMVLSADELESGEVNKQNEVWIKPGRQFGVPIKIGGLKDGYVMSWEFSSQPKDIVFSLKFCRTEDDSLSEGEEIVAPCKCDAHKQMHRGELTPKRPGVYTLVFDNSYSRMTSKKIHYHLEYRKSS